MGRELAVLKLALSPPGKMHETLQGISTWKYLQVYREFSSISTVKVNICQIFIFYKTNWNFSIINNTKILKLSLKIHRKIGTFI